MPLVQFCALIKLLKYLRLNLSVCVCVCARHMSNVSLQGQDQDGFLCSTAMALNRPAFVPVPPTVSTAPLLHLAAAVSVCPFITLETLPPNLDTAEGSIGGLSLSAPISSYLLFSATLAR